MKAQVINTDFLHDGTYYKQNSIIDIHLDIVKKYPKNLFVVGESINETKIKEPNNISQMIQDNLPAGRQGSTANNMLAPSAEIVKPSRQVGTKKNKRGR